MRLRGPGEPKTPEKPARLSWTNREQNASLPSTARETAPGTAPTATNPGRTACT